MSKSDTKAQNGTEPARRNRMIPTFCFPGWQRRGSFVSDLDTAQHIVAGRAARGVALRVAPRRPA